MEAEYERLAKTIFQQASVHPKQRYLVGIAGAPGSGKTTTASAVVNHINKLAATSSPPCRAHAALLSMDGFHLPRSVLDRLPNREEAYIRRGAPWTFDASSFLQFMCRLRAWADKEAEPKSLDSPSTERAEDTVIYAPTFDHETKDPVENGTAVTGDISIVIIEGNYLLLDEDEWRDVAPLVDYKAFINVDLQEARVRLARRHVQAGIEKTLQDGFKRVDANDYLNGLWIMEKLIKPDVVIQSVEE